MTHDTAESTASLGVDQTARTRRVVVLLLGVVVQGVLLVLVREDGELERLDLVGVALRVGPLHLVEVLELVRVPAGGRDVAGGGLLGEGLGGRGGKGDGLLFASLVLVFASDLGSSCQYSLCGSEDGGWDLGPRKAGCVTDCITRAFFEDPHRVGNCCGGQEGHKESLDVDHIELSGICCIKNFGFALEKLL